MDVFGFELSGTLLSFGTFLHVLYRKCIVYRDFVCASPKRVIAFICSYKLNLAILTALYQTKGIINPLLMCQICDFIYFFGCSLECECE